MALHVRFDHALRGYRASADLTVESGETVALVGPSGAGKTTIASLIPRLYDVTGGAVRVDGIDVRNLTQTTLHQAIGVVAHDFTDEHRTLLGANALAYVLHQDIHYCISTAARVLRALCENMRGALNVVQPRVEILTAENLH